MTKVTGRTQSCVVSIHVLLPAVFFFPAFADTLLGMYKNKQNGDPPVNTLLHGATRGKTTPQVAFKLPLCWTFDVFPLHCPTGFVCNLLMLKFKC